MKKRHYLFASVILLLCVFLMPGPCTKQVSAASKKLSNTSKTIYVSKSGNIYLRNYKSGKITWSTSNKKVVTVKSSKTKCTLKGVKAGKATITCKIKKGSKTTKLRCKVTVKLYCSNHNLKTKTTKSATCTSAGTTKTYCTRCTYSKTSTIAPLGHAVIDNNKLATCSTVGQTAGYCTRCKQNVDIIYIPATGHTFTNNICTTCGAAAGIDLLSDQLEAVGSLLVAQKWLYSNSGITVSYAKAIKNNNHKSNCALYVSHAMQNAGLIPTNVQIYAKSDGTLNASTSTKEYMANMGARYYKCSSGQKLSLTDLMPGDIVLWKSHTNVFKGMTDSGLYAWYDAGKGCTNTKKDQGTYVRYIREITVKFKKSDGTSDSFTSDNKIYGIIRFNDTPANDSFTEVSLDGSTPSTETTETTSPSTETTAASTETTATTSRSTETTAASTETTATTSRSTETTATNN